MYSSTSFSLSLSPLYLFMTSWKYSCCRDDEAEVRKAYKASSNNTKEANE